MAAKFCFLLFLLLHTANGATLFERSYEYLVSWGKSLAPNFLDLVDCVADDDVWGCTKLKAGKMLDVWGQDVDQQRRAWQESADAEVQASGRSYNELPSKIGMEIESSANTLNEILQSSLARAFRGFTQGGGIQSVTVTTNEKKKKEKKKKQPTHVHHAPAPTMAPKVEDKGLEHDKQSNIVNDLVEHDNLSEVGHDLVEHEEMGVARGFIEDVWSYGEKSVDAMAEHVMKAETKDSELHDNNSVHEQRGKKKKKKKAILKLLLLGAVLKAKIGTLLQILSFKLQVKFLLIALVGLLINIARFWIDVKKNHAQPQKVIYYEHAQHQHHYDHEEEPGWGGPWSRSIDPEEAAARESEIMIDNSPYRVQEGYQRARMIRSQYRK